ncbi:MAG: (d)CMP kinase [Planctomycetes bacterium]|nr:(d)CMP kinase [Planctomycetota bacterium]
MSTVPVPSQSATRDVPTDVVAIDGPAGAGKSTVARALAKALGWAHLDTGAMYRAVTIRLLDLGAVAVVGERVTVDAARVGACIAGLELAIDGDGHVRVEGADVTPRLREPRVDVAVSAVAALAVVRERLRDTQREFARARPTVAEGRDIGTVVFPRAAFKIWLDASVEERARRRRVDHAGGGRDVPLADVVADLARRDALDSGRSLAPLARAADATVVDTTGLSVDEVVTRLWAIVVSRRTEAREGAR